MILRILGLFIIIIGITYLIRPDLFKFNNLSFFQNNTINPHEYVLTPDPSVLFLEGLKISTIKDYGFNGIAQGADLYFQAVNLFQVNIIQLLEDSPNKSTTLATYIAQLENLIDKITNTIGNLTSFYTEEESLANNYYQQKQQGDNTFNEGFIEKDASLVNEGVKTAYKNGPEYMKHRILANAAKIVVSKLTNIKQLLQAKLVLLQTNENDIINNFELIKGNLLPKLLELKRRLETNYYY